MNELRLIELIDTTIEDVNDPEHADEFIVTLVEKCLDFAFDDNDKNGQITKEMISEDGNELLLYPVVCKFDDYWNYCITYLKERYQVDIFRFADIILLQLMVQSTYQSLKDSFIFASKHLLEVKENTVKSPNYVKTKRTLIDFFETLEKIQIFYYDKEMYDSDDKKELHDKLTAMYSSLMNGCS